MPLCRTPRYSQVPYHKMESSSPFQSMLYRYDTQGYPGGFQSLQEGQYGNIRAEGFPVPTYRVSPWDTASWKSSLSSKKRNASIAMPETGFDTRCMGYDGSSNELLDFSAGWSCMLPPRKRSVIWVDQQLKGNDALSCMPAQAAMDSSLSMVDFQAHSTPYEPVQYELLGFPGLNNIGHGDQGFLMPVNDPLSLNHAGSSPFSLESIKAIKLM